MRIGKVTLIDVKEDTCSVLFPSGEEVKALLFTDKVPDINSSVVVVKDEFSNMYIVIAVKDSYRKKKHNYTFNPYSLDSKSITEYNDKLPGDVVLSTDIGTSLHLMSSGTAVLKASYENMIVLNEDNDYTWLKNKGTIFSVQNGSMSLNNLGLYYEKRSPNNINEATDKLCIGDNSIILKNVNTSSGEQSRFYINESGKLNISHRNISLTNSKSSNQTGLTDEPQIDSVAQVEILPDNTLKLEVIPDNTNSLQRRLYVHLKESNGSIKIAVSDVNADDNNEVTSDTDNKALIEIKNNLELNIWAKNNVSVHTESDMSLTANGRIDIIAGGNVNIQGSRIDLN